MTTSRDEPGQGLGFRDESGQKVHSGSSLDVGFSLRDGGSICDGHKSYFHDETKGDLLGQLIEHLSKWHDSLIS